MKKFFVIFLAVFLAVWLSNTFMSYSESHLLLKYRQIKTQDGDPSGDIQAYIVKTPFHNAQGIHIYMIPVYEEHDEGGYWTRLPADEEVIHEGRSFTLFEHKTETSQISYLIVCSPKELSTYEEVRDESLNPYYRNSDWVEPSTIYRMSIVLKCK